MPTQTNGFPWNALRNSKLAILPRNMPMSAIRRAMGATTHHTTTTTAPPTVSQKRAEMLGSNISVVTSPPREATV